MKNKRVVLILGNRGMLGSMLEKYFNLQSDKYNIHVLNRSSFNATKLYLYEDIDFSKYDYVINCMGITKGIIEGRSNKKVTEEEVIQVNSILPWWLARKTKKIIHISTDCIFSGNKEVDKMYNCYDIPDANDLYGLSKRLGEPKNCMVIRSSFVGPSIKGEGVCLFDWLVQNKGQIIDGYDNHYWNGITTLQLAKYLYNIIDNNRYKVGIYHLSSPDDYTKYELCKCISDIFDLKLIVNKNIKTLTINRCLVDTEYSIMKAIPIKQQLIELKEFMEKYYK